MMSIKRFILFCLAIVFASFVSFAQDLTPEQTALKSDIVAFLTDEGLPFSEDSSGDIHFNYFGHDFSLRISRVDKKPFYIVLSENVDAPKDLSESEQCVMVNGLNKCKAVKVVYKDGRVSFREELFLENVSQFTSSFRRYMSIFNNLHSDFDAVSKEPGKDSGGAATDIFRDLVCAKYPLIIDDISVGISDENKNWVTEPGKKLYSYNTMYLSPCIIYRALCTGTITLKVKLYDSTGGLNHNSSPDYSYSHSLDIRESYLGVRSEDGNGQVAVTEVIDGMAAHNSGIMVGDIIVSMGASKITDNSSLTTAIRGLNIGDKTTVTVLRNGGKMQKDVVIVPMSDSVQLVGWGRDTKGYWPAGTYRFEIWYDDVCLGSKTFTIY